MGAVTTMEGGTCVGSGSGSGWTCTGSGCACIGSGSGSRWTNASTTIGACTLGTFESLGRFGGFSAAVLHKLFIISV